MGYIYKITNLINHKIYIGLTTNTIEHRWKQHTNSADRPDAYYLLYRAINKYGIENFKIEELEQCDNNLLKEREKYWIKKMDSFYLNGYGYNMTYGGEGVTKYSNEQILNLWNKGLKASEIAKELGAHPTTIGERLKTLLPPGEARKRHINSNKKSVLQYDIFGNLIKQWESATQAEKELDMSAGNITRCCKKNRVIANNFLWKYSFDNTPIIELMINYAKSNKCNGVDRIDKNKNILESFDSAKAAELHYNLPRGKVSAVCNHIRNKTGGYYWQWSYPLKRKIIEV